MKVLVLGATGLVGRNVLTQVLARPEVTQVIAPTRKPLPPQDRLMNPVAPKLEELLPEMINWRPNAVICERDRDRRLPPICGDRDGRRRLSWIPRRRENGRRERIAVRCHGLRLVLWVSRAETVSALVQIEAHRLEAEEDR